MASHLPSSSSYSTTHHPSHNSSASLSSVSSTTSSSPSAYNHTADDRSPRTPTNSSSFQIDSSSVHSSPRSSRRRHRRPSTSSIVPREHPQLELRADDESFDSDDARTMSPRRSSEDTQRMSREARAELQAHALTLQASLLEIFNRIEAVREEHDKLDNNNKFLQKYIGDLMATSKITGSSFGTASGGGGNAGGGGGRKR